jgi:AcrR family transcriptional regulator
MEAALTTVMDKGFAGTSTLDIASRAKVSKRDLYLVATSKSELLRQAITERVGRLATARAADRHQPRSARRYADGVRPHHPEWRV